jgi:hypothetical protein
MRACLIFVTVYSTTSCGDTKRCDRFGTQILLKTGVFQNVVVVRGPGGSGVIKCYKQIKVTVYKSNAHATTGQESPEMEQRYSSTLSLTLSNPIFLPPAYSPALI